MNKKKNLGQFYTTNYEYILQNLEIPENIKDIVEPFAGNGDLLNFIDKTKYNLECYDIDPKQDYIIKRDTLVDPPNFLNKFILTNPPYLARNKCDNKTLYDRYNTNDLYKCFIEILIRSECKGGILIIPLNFLCSIRKSDIELRKRFLEKYDIKKINIFEEQVFEDTSYTICSFIFEISMGNCNDIECFIYPNKKIMRFSLNSQNNYTIGGEIYNHKNNSNYSIDRATRLTEKKESITNILVKCIDDNSENRICLLFIDDCTRDKYIDKTPKLSSRSYAILVIDPPISSDQQKELIVKFNKYLNDQRDVYNSLFLNNFRESNTIARKRISFSLVYNICGFLIDNL